LLSAGLNLLTVDRDRERLKADFAHDGLHGDGLPGVALPEKNERQVDVLRLGKVPAGGSRAKLVPQGQEFGAGFGGEVYGGEKAHDMILLDKR